MTINFDRFQNLPCITKLTTISTTILLILTIGSARIQPSGTEFIWLTALLSLVVDVVCGLILALELDEVLLPETSATILWLRWHVLECIISTVFAIAYFISVWLCINGYNYGSAASFTLAAVLCLANCFQYTFNILVYLRLWKAADRDVSDVIIANRMRFPSYGSL